MNVPPPIDAADDNSFSALNAYLDQMHAGDPSARERLLAEHPELAGALECLDALDRLAPPPSALPGRRVEAPPGSNDPTVGVPAPVGEGAAAPTSFGKYDILEEIGRGGMGVVYKAWQKDLDRPVALKMILSGHLASADHVCRFHDEAKAAANLNHPHIVAVYEAGQLHGQPYFAMQFVAGPSLAGVLGNGPLPFEQAAHLVEDIARAVHHLHARGFVHRDLKPSNILLDEQSHPYVTDFGLVKMLGDDSHKTVTGAILGTPSYMAPEQAAGRVREIGPRSDVYSLGAILYETLTGRPPFREESPLDTLVQVLEGEPIRPTRINPAVPPDLETICLKCLEKDPGDRYESAEALAADLHRHLDGEEIEAQRAGPLGRLRRWARREPALASRLVVLAVCCLIIQINYHVVNYHVSGGVDPTHHLQVMSLFGLWGLASFVFQRILSRKEGLNWIPFAWSAADMVLLTALLVLDAHSPTHAHSPPHQGFGTPFLIGFPTLIATAGLWFRVALVWFTTGLALAGYGVLLIDHILYATVRSAPHQHVIFAVGLLTVGFVIAYQVKRVRALSRYYERRPLP
ncbi:MAG: serine/threonine protein kinase [Gemmataceae bacterium]|nr:serine/threonine protein kinase [Gemmataceae bacterium]